MDSKIHSIIQEIWGNRRCAWSLVRSEGASVGFISIWNGEVLWLEDVLLDQRVLAALSLNLIRNVRCRWGILGGPLRGLTRIYISVFSIKGRNTSSIKGKIHVFVQLSNSLDEVAL